MPPPAASFALSGEDRIEPERMAGWSPHGVTSLFGAFDIADGTAISELHRRPGTRSS
jgi:hypothetical protein